MTKYRYDKATDQIVEKREETPVLLLPYLDPSPEFREFFESMQRAFAEMADNHLRRR
jgi:hypothetical protein